MTDQDFAAYGRFMLAFSGLECAITDALVDLIRGDCVLAASVVSALNFQRRLAILKQASETASSQTELAETGAELAEVCRLIAAVNAWRNARVHGRPGIHEGEETVFGRTGEPAIIDTVSCNEHCAMITKAQVNLGAYIPHLVSNALWREQFDSDWDALFPDDDWHFEAPRAYPRTFGCH